MDSAAMVIFSTVCCRQRVPPQLAGPRPAPPSQPHYCTVRVTLDGMAILSESDIRERLAEGWSIDGSAIAKTYEFDDFNQAMKFMVTAAPGIDALNHHPEWTNVYNRVDVRLTSHDSDGVTERDMELAQLLDSLI